jgi:hypothetical protein
MDRGQADDLADLRLVEQQRCADRAREMTALAHKQFAAQMGDAFLGIPQAKADHPSQ